MIAPVQPFLTHYDTDALADMAERTAIIHHRTKGRIVRLNAGKYKDRLAEVDGVLAGSREWLFLCRVLRRDGVTKLNASRESRRWLPISMFEDPSA